MAEKASRRLDVSNIAVAAAAAVIATATAAA